MDLNVEYMEACMAVCIVVVNVLVMLVEQKLVQDVHKCMEVKAQ